MGVLGATVYPRSPRMPWTCEICQAPSPGGSSFCAACGAQRLAGRGDPRIGELVLGRYRIAAKLGEGGTGAVYRAEQKMGTTTRPVAVKILHASHVRDPSARARFVRECELVVHLAHRNTIKFFDFGELSDGSLAIAMEYVEGEPLAKELERGPVPLERAIRILGQICGSLHEAHSHGIVHRDLKPDNVLLSHPAGERDVVKVLDFGIAKTPPGGGPAHGALTVQGTVLGTPQYMSPEQFAGRELDARSDVYSLGVLTYEMLTGAYPFAPAQNVFEWAERHLNAAPTPIDAHPVAASLPRAACATIMRSLEKDPARRPPSVLEFARGLIGSERMDTGWGLATLRHAPAPQVGPTSVIRSPAPVGYPPPGSAPPRKGLGLAALITLGLGVFMGAGAVVGGYLLLRADPSEPAARPPRVVAAGAVSPPQPVEPVPVPPPRPPPSPPPPPPAEPETALPEHWLRIVHHERAVLDASAATGPPDRRYAQIPSRGVLTLELLPGSVVATDGGPGPDLYVVVDSASAPYRVEAAGSHDRFRVIVAEVTGTLPLDLDQYLLETVRYVRFSSRGAAPVLLDAVGVHRITAAPAHDH